MKDPAFLLVIKNYGLEHDGCESHCGETSQTSDSRRRGYPYHTQQHNTTIDAFFPDLVLRDRPFASGTVSEATNPCNLYQYLHKFRHDVRRNDV